MTNQKFIKWRRIKNKRAVFTALLFGGCKKAVASILFLTESIIKELK